MSPILQPASFQGGDAGGDGTLDQFVDQGIRTWRGDLQRQVLGTGGVGGDVGQVPLGLLAEESSILAFSAASLRRCRPAHPSSWSTPDSFLNSSMM